jgi:nickel/cobalt exporter
VKRWLAVVAVAGALLTPGVASAHPLGNFTVNHYAHIETRVDGVRINYVLDEAEIPTFQDRPRYSAEPQSFADQRASELASNLHVTLNGTPLALSVESPTLSLREGAGGLPTLRLEASFVASFASVSQPTQLDVRDDNDPTRIGWREIVASTDDGVALQRSDVPVADVSDALRNYPQDLLSSPLDVRAATLTLAPAGAAMQTPVAPRLSGNAVLDRAQSAFADLANVDELTPGFIVFALGVALVLGAAHALQPGHGKTVVAAYLVGSRGTPRHAVVLGATVTLTHTAGVYALGLVTLVLSHYIVPERLYPVLEAGSGVLVLAIGVWLLGRRASTALHRGRVHPHPVEGEAVSAEGTHQHDGHSHHHPHAGHGHAHGETVGWRSLLALGVSGGLLPCPEALMVLLITIAAHRVLFGLLLIVTFSIGLARVLVGFGLLLVYARKTFSRLNVSSGLVPRLLPVASALVIVVAGGAITLQALPQVL